MDYSRVDLRFAILTEAPNFPAWAAECLERLQASGHARLAAVLVVRSPPALAGRQRQRVLPRLYQQYWIARHSLALRRVQLSEHLSGVPTLELSTTNGVPTREALDAISEYRLDFVLQFDPLIVPNELLTLPRFGVWSFCQQQRAAPFFWEVVDGHAKTRVTLERLTREGPVCLHEGYFATCRASWVNNIDRARLGAADFCARVCAEIAHTGGERILSGSAAPAAAEREPSNRDIVSLLAKSAARSVDKLWELLFHMEIWNVGFSGKSVERVLRDACVDDLDVTWCQPHKPRHFIADPFPYVHRGRPRVLVEDYDQAKGKICSIDPERGGPALDLAIDLEFPYHLSYPCIFEEAGNTYCIPEAYQSNRVSLYQRTEQGWCLVRHLIEGLPVVDPTLFKHEGLYWLLFTLQNDGAWGNQKLYAYHAPSLDAPWVPHPLNPVKCDIGATRPAGNVFSCEGALFRPSQDCSRTYGGAVVINQIVTLSQLAFEERVAARIEPIADGPYPHGLHTLNAMGDRTVFDSKKFAFDWLAWRKNWGRLHEVLR
jgi:hypothetical protein